MAPNLTKENSGKTLPDISVDREKGAVVLAMRDGAHRATLTTTKGGAAALAATLAAAADALEDWEGELSIRGDLEARKGDA